MYCSNCGSVISDRDTFCSGCGAAISRPAAPVSTQAPVAAQAPVYNQTPVYQQPAPQQPSYQQPVYQQPAPQQPAYQQPVAAPQTAATGNQSNGCSVAGFILALVSVIIGVLSLSIRDKVPEVVFNTGSIIAFIATIPGLIISIIGVAKSNKMNGIGKGRAVTGIILSAIQFGFSSFIVFLIAI